MRTETEQREAEVERRMAVRRAGYKMIRLVLMLPEYRNICGVEKVNAVPYYDERNNREQYHMEVIGGDLEWRRSVEHGGEEVADMLDTPHNREFLASHLDTEAWEIEASDDVVADIKRRRQEQIKSALDAGEDVDGSTGKRVSVSEISRMLPGESIVPEDLENLSDEELVKVEARLQAIKERRTIAEHPVRDLDAERKEQHEEDAPKTELTTAEQPEEQEDRPATRKRGGRGRKRQSSKSAVESSLAEVGE